MQKHIVIVLIFLSAALADTVSQVYKGKTLFRGIEVEKLVLGKNGNPAFITGAFGSVPNGDLEMFIMNNLKNVLGLQGTEKFVEQRTSVDIAGHKHIFYQQYNRGLEVDGGVIGLHINRHSNEVYAITTSVMPDLLEKTPAVHDNAEIVSAIHSVVQEFQFEIEPELVYLIYNDNYYLAYRSLINYEIRVSNFFLCVPMIFFSQLKRENTFTQMQLKIK
jgi:Zn-dependent metalloprotease